jgi:hypothetical protein
MGCEEKRCPKDSPKKDNKDGRQESLNIGPVGLV